MITKDMIRMHEHVACVSLPSSKYRFLMLPQVSKRDGSGNASKEIKQKQKQVGNRDEITLSTSKASNV